MDGFCEQCRGMTLRRLLDLNKISYRAGFFPAENYYHHHSSFAELQTCATQPASPCPLCRLILGCFQSAQHDPLLPTWPTPSHRLVKGDGESPGMTIADAALQLPQSDIRVVLGARHVGVGAFLSAIRMFDLLTIRIGSRPNLGDPLRTPELILVLRVPGPTESPLAEAMLPTMDGYRIGCAEIDRRLGSATNLRLARRWLDCCMRDHTGCGATTRPPRLPTRVVDVMASPPRLVQSKDVNANGPYAGCGHYVALSHCWGGPIKTLLLSTTMADFQKALPSAADLPANFRDAMAITRELGIRYLWIDSLCIIQNSVQDWRRESKQMAEVYGRATVSLMAMASAASHTGILAGANNTENRITNDAQDVIVPLEVGSPHGAASRVVNFKVGLIHQDNECLRLLSEKSPLSVRGWCLQELIFSSRVLYFGKEQIYWKCPEGGHKSAEGLPDGNMYINHRHPQIAVDLHSDAGSDDRSDDGPPVDEENNADKILRSFHDFVVSYTQRQLSFGTDKFPAVSSFALQVYNGLERSRRADPIMKEHVYIAGIWSSDFRRGLLFCPDGMHSPHVTQEAETEYRAPSWSWAVTDAPLTILSPPNISDKPTSSLNLELASWHTVLRDPDNAFGAVDYAHLIVKGRICSLRSRNVPFIGAYTWDREAEEGTAWFDDAPTVIDPAGNTSVVNTDNGNCRLFLGHQEGNDVYLATYYCAEPGQTATEKEIVHPSIKDCKDQGCILLLVDLGHEDTAETNVYNTSSDGEDASDADDDDDDWEMAEKLIHCLLLRPVADARKHRGSEDTDGVYERVGCAVLDWRNRRRVQKWRLQTLKLV